MVQGKAIIINKHQNKSTTKLLRPEKQLPQSFFLPFHQVNVLIVADLFLITSLC